MTDFPQQDTQSELIRATIRASMLEAMGKFRDEMTEMLKQYYTREMSDRFNKELKDDIEGIRQELHELKEEGKKTRFDLDNLWDNTFVRLGAALAVAYVLIQIWQSLPHH